MPAGQKCSFCRQGGHNIRTCPVAEEAAEAVRDEGIDAGAEWVAERFNDEALGELVGAAADLAFPGAGMLVRCARAALK